MKRLLATLALLLATTTAVAQQWQYIPRLKVDSLRVGNTLTYDVTFYGAIPNDNLSDSTAIQNAINAWETGGGQLLFPPGTYNLSTGLTVTWPADHQTPKLITGYGANLSSTVPSGCIFTIDNATDKAVRGLTIEGLRTTATGTECHILIDGGTPTVGFLWAFNMRDIEMSGGTGDGLRITGSAFEFQLENVRWQPSNSNIAGKGIFIDDNDGSVSAVSSCELINLNTRYGLYGLEIENTDCDLYGGTFLEAREECIHWESTFGGSITGPHVEKCWRSGADSTGKGGLNVIGPATVIAPRCTSPDANMPNCVGTFASAGETINIFGGGLTSTNPTTSVYVRNNAAGYTVNLYGVEGTVTQANDANTVVNQYATTGYPGALLEGPMITKVDPEFDVRAYGAVCDGATNDSTAIQAAITAADAIGGGWVTLPPNSVCAIATGLNLHRYVGLRGRKSVLLATAPIKMLNILDAANVSPITGSLPLGFEGLVVDGADVATQGIYVDELDGCPGRDTEIRRINGPGVVWDKTQNTLWTEVRVFNSNHGFYAVNEAGNVTCQGCETSQIDGHHVFMGDDATQPNFDAGADDGPFAIKFFDSQFERQTANPITTEMIQLSKGLRFTCDGCGIVMQNAAGASTITSLVNITANATDTRLRHCGFNISAVPDGSDGQIAVSNSGSQTLLYYPRFVGFSGATREPNNVVRANARTRVEFPTDFETFCTTFSTCDPGTQDLQWTEYGSYRNLAWGSREQHGDIEMYEKGDGTASIFSYFDDGANNAIALRNTDSSNEEGSPFVWFRNGGSNSNDEDTFIGSTQLGAFYVRNNASLNIASMSQTGTTQLGADGVDGKLALFNDTSNFTSTFQTTTQGANITYTLPPNDGGTNEALISNGSGVLTWGGPTSLGESCTFSDGAILCDQNNNGVTDWAYVGDYDDDGSLEMTDIDTVAAAMTEGGILIVAPGTYQPALDIANTKGLIELSSGTRLECSKGTILKGPRTYAGTDGGTGTDRTVTPTPSQSWTVDSLIGFTAYSATDNNGCTITSNTADTATCSSPKSSGTFAGDAFWITRLADDQPVISNETITGNGDHDIEVIGCEIDGGMPPTGYNPTGFNIGRAGISMQHVTRWTAARNFVHDTRHTGIYAKDSVEGKVLGNDVKRVGNWQGATGLNAGAVYPCFYLFASEQATGTHTGANDAATLTDGAANFPVGSDGVGLLVDSFVTNTNETSACKITANTATTITCDLLGGTTENFWDTGDAYVVGGMSTRNTYSDNTCESYGSGGLSTRANAVSDQITNFTFARNIMRGQSNSDTAECLVIAGVDGAQYIDNKCINTGSVLLSPVATGWFTSGDGGMRSDPANTRDVVIDGLQMTGCNSNCITLGANHQAATIRNVTIDFPDAEKHGIVISNPHRNLLLENVEVVGINGTAGTTAGLYMSNAQTVANTDEQLTIRNWYSTYGGTNGYGMRFDGATRGLTINGARIFNNTGSNSGEGIFFNGVTEGLQANDITCQARTANDDCIHFEVDANNHLTFNGIRLENSNTSAYAIYFHNATASNVVITDVTAYGPSATTVGGAVRTDSANAVTGYATNVRCTNKGGNPCFLDQTTDTWRFVNVDGEGSWESEYFPADRLRADGTECTAPANVTIASGAVQPGIVCPLGGANVDGFVYGSMVMPDGWDAGTLVFSLLATSDTDPGGTETLQGVINAQCFTPATADVFDNSWTAAQGLDVGWVVGDAQWEIMEPVATAITPDNTCVAGDTILFRYVACDTGTPPTSGCTASDANAVTDTTILGIKMEWLRNAND